MREGGCESHSALLPVREGKECWLNLYAPGGVASHDDGQLYAEMVRALLLEWEQRHIVGQNVCGGGPI